MRTIGVTLDEALIKPIVLTPPLRLVDPASWVPHIPFAFWLVDALRPSVVVELGTQSGNSYAAFAQAVQLLGLDTACYAIDTWTGDPQAGFYDETVFAEWSAFHERHFSGFSRLVRSTFDEARATFADRSIELLHIDGLHTYDAVRHDFETWLPKLGDRGVVLLHDINVREEGFGAWKLWQQLEARFPAFAFLHGHGLGMVGVGRDLPPVVAWLLHTVAANPDNAALVRQYFATLGDRLHLQRRLAAIERRQATVEVPDSGPRLDASHEIDRLRGELRAAGQALAATRATQASEGARTAAALVRGLRRELAESDRELAAALDDTERLTESIARLVADLAAKEATVRLLTTRLGAIRRSPSWQMVEAARTSPRWLREVGVTPGVAFRRPARFARSVKAMLSPRRARDLRLAATSGLFDQQYYLLHNADVQATRIAPLVHYVLSGGAEGRAPSVLFDGRFYLLRNPDVARAGGNPLVHFLMHGSAEGRDPHPLFSMRYYLDRNPDIAALEDDPFLHFVASGGREGRSPHPLFDAAFYLDANPDVRAAGVNPLVHFLERGAAEGRSPHELFDSTHYLSQNRGVQEARSNPLLHYLDVALRENRNPHPLFDNRYYLEQVPELRARGVNPLAHFIVHGAAEGRRPNPWFDPSWYLHSNPDVAKGGVNPLAHYARYGWREGRDPSPEFSTSFYLTHHTDVAAAGLNPLAHYLAVGAREGRLSRPARVPQLAARPPAPKRVTIKATGAAGGGPPKPTVICVSHAVPWPPRAGNEFRVHRLLQRLRATGYRVVLVAAPLPGDAIDLTRFDALADAFGNVVYCERDGTVQYRLDECPDVLQELDQQTTGNYATRLGEVRPLAGPALDLLQIERTYCHETVVAVTSRLQATLKPATVVVEYVWMSRLLPLLDRGVLSVIDTLDVFFSKREKVAVYGIEDWDVAIEEEVRRLIRADVIVAIQREEAGLLAGVLPGREILMTGVDFDVVANAWPSEPVAFLVGSDNPMNVAGLRDFLRFAWPDIQRRVPGARLDVAGRIGRTVPAHTDGVRTLGHVDDLAPCYERARVVVNPAAAGTGLKIKTVEAIGNLRPVVTWPNGLDGVPEPLARMMPPVRDWLEFIDRVVHHLSADRSPFDAAAVRAIQRELSPDVVYQTLEARLARFFREAAEQPRA
jgi:hypothetical protein